MDTNTYMPITPDGELTFKNGVPYTGGMGLTGAGAWTGWTLGV